MTVNIIIKLLLSILVGGIIGAEREYRNKSAGFRTMMLISLGAMLFTHFSLEIGAGYSPDRIAANIVTGVGFLGAGVIFKDGAGINGITTAATIWVTAALGMGIGAGYEWISITGTLLLLPILFAFTRIESWIDQVNHAHEYKIVVPGTVDFLDRFEKLFREYNLRYRKVKHQKQGNSVSGTWELQGREKNHKQFIDYMLKDPDIQEFEF